MTKSQPSAFGRFMRKIVLTIIALTVYACAVFFWMQYEINRLCDQLRDVEKTSSFTSKVPLKYSEFFLLRTASERVSPRYEYALSILGAIRSERGRVLMEEYLNSHLWRERYAAISGLAYYQDDRMLETYLQQLLIEKHPSVIQNLFISIMKSRNRITPAYLESVEAAASGNESRYYLQRVKDLIKSDFQTRKFDETQFDAPALERIRFFDSVWNDEKGASGKVPASGALRLEAWSVQ
ncbi:MAG: hypothetical protein MUC65_10240 [Pontiellaceae bacterium]|jgi:hypothetical protein|nr:hypothetical protein [Pontiellaceae bacterium]